VRFSDAELAVVSERAALAGLAVGAWIGQSALDFAPRGLAASLDLPDLLRLHADVVLVARAAAADPLVNGQVERLLSRLDAVVDAVVVESERARR